MTQADLDAVSAIEIACFTSAWSRESIEFELNDNPFCHPLVLEEEGRVAGFAFVWVIFEEAQLADLAVDPALQRHGYGQKLLDAVIEEGKKSRCETVSLEVRPSNTPALTLYEKNGFVPVRRVRAYYSNGEDAIVMALGI